LDSKVYDLSHFDHPGGQGKIIQFCGQDGFASFRSKHPLAYLHDKLESDRVNDEDVTKSLQEQQKCP